MHIIRKLLLFRVALWATLVLVGAYIVSFAFGVKLVSETDKATGRTVTVLTGLSKTQSLMEAAVNEGRNMLFTNTYDHGRLVSLRDAALQSIDEIDALVAGDVEQERNVGQLRAAFLYRTSLQDEQIRTSGQSGGNLQIDVGLGQQLAKSIYDTETAVSAVRVYELNNLLVKDVSRSQTQWLVIYYMAAFMAGSMALTVFLFGHLIGELKYRRQIAERLRQDTHISVDGELQYTQKDIDELLRIIEEGETAVRTAARRG